jgi:hypothetical protein
LPQNGTGDMLVLSEIGSDEVAIGVAFMPNFKKILQFMHTVLMYLIA